MSDLRERLKTALTDYYGSGNVHPDDLSDVDDLIGVCQPIIEAELQKRDREIERLDRELLWEREVVGEDRETTLTEANKLLEQTIEVLEGFPWNHTPAWSRNMGVHLVLWFDQQAKPLLDNLKALKKEGTE